MNAKTSILAFLLVVVCYPLTAVGQQAAVALRAGTLGPGLEVHVGVMPSLNVRVGGTYLPVNLSGTFEEEDTQFGYDVSSQALSGSARVDWNPVGGLRVSGGLVFNSTSAEASVEARSNFTAGQRTFTPAQMGSLSADLSYKNKIEPYLGLGYGNPIREGKRFGFLVDLGVIYSGPAEVEMSGTGMIGPTTDQQPVINDALEGVKIYPVFNLGVSYAF